MPTPRKPCRVCGSTDREPGVEKYCSRKCHVAAYSAPQPNGCIVWTGAIKNIGYGIITMRDRSYHAHRVAWELVNGPIESGKVVCHTCDNRACVNTAHMFIGTHADNSADMKRKNRHVHGEKASWSKLSEEQARIILADTTTPHAEYARLFNVSDVAVSRIRKRQNWKHLTEGPA